MRRIYDPTQYEFLQPVQPMNRFITISAFLLFVAQLPFIFNFFWSLWKGEKAGKNPWNDNGLEWTVPSPPPHGNFATTPTVYRGPYEFSSPLVDEDFLPQDVPLDGDRKPAPERVSGD
jgi:cytochrome c oxidase subunit 1